MTRAQATTNHHYEAGDIEMRLYKIIHAETPSLSYLIHSVNSTELIVDGSDNVTKVTTQNHDVSQ